MTILDLGFEDAHRFIGGRRQRFAGAQTEARTMARANNFLALDLAAGQWRAVVSADVLDGEIILSAARDGDHAAPDGNGSGLTVGQASLQSRIDPSQPHLL